MPAAPRELRLPTPALGALRAAVLATPDGELRLRDAGFAAGGALYDAFAAEEREAGGPDPAALPLEAFVGRVAAFFLARGWGALDVAAPRDADTVTLAAADWAEAEAAGAGGERGGLPYPACHPSTGLFAGFLARVAGRPLAVLEVRCRAAGAARCEFVAGSPAVMDRVWEAMMRGGPTGGT